MGGCASPRCERNLSYWGKEHCHQYRHGKNPNLPFTLIDEGNTASANTAALYTDSLTGGSNWYKDISSMKVLDIGNKRKGYYLNGLKGRNRQNLRAKICQIVICFLSKCSSIAWAFQSVKKQHWLNFAGSGVGLLCRPYYIGENSRVPSIHHLYGSNTTLPKSWTDDTHGICTQYALWKSAAAWWDTTFWKFIAWHIPYLVVYKNCNWFYARFPPRRRRPSGLCAEKSACVRS